MQPSPRPIKHGQRLGLGPSSFLIKLPPAVLTADKDLYVIEFLN